MICGLQEPSSGSYTLYGAENRSRNMAKMRRRMGAVVETPAIYPDMSARENLEQQYRVLGLPSMSGVDGLLKLVGLSDTGRKKAGNFSLGMRQRLGIAVALCGGPDFLVLDKPINGLDPEGIVEIRELDRSMLDRILENLLNNACRYAEGALTVRLSEDGSIELSNPTQIGSLEAAKLFDRFYTVRTAKGSTGLGLTIARTLTERMGGTIDAESENGLLTIRLRFNES